MHRHDRSLIPAGMTTILPRTAERVRRLEDILMTRLGRWGYREIIPPAFEYLDVLSAGLEPELIEKCYKFADRTTGRILLLRPDVTAQIARIVAMGMVDSELPLRLCYRTTVFRHEPEHAGREREIFQVGAELIGVDNVAMDGEIIALMIESLKQLGLPAFTISLGHVGFFKALVAKSGLSLEGQKRAEHAAARKDLPQLEEILRQEHVSKRKAAGILETPGLYGREEVLERGRSLAGQDRELRAALERLSQLYALLVSSGMKSHLVLDLGEFRGFDYYDGVVFDVFADGIGYELGGGGRYNHLIGRFGRDLPSTGFAFDMDRLFRAIERVGDGLPRTHADVLVSAPTARGAQLFQVAHRLREGGLRIVQGTLSGSEADWLRQAIAEGRRLAVSTAVILGAPRLSSDDAMIVTGLSGPARSMGRRSVKIKDLPSLITKKI
jgi:ATP phosphoribosyltransferase regulatory subunit